MLLISSRLPYTTEHGSVVDVQRIDQNIVLHGEEIDESAAPTWRAF